ncbi:MAG: hypothetical protein ACK5CA_07980 [Cyanobacteriota bacterium]
MINFIANGATLAKRSVKESLNRMAKPSEGSLPPNPFQTYRDPQTGEWRVTLAPQRREKQDSFDEDNPSQDGASRA